MVTTEIGIDACVAEIRILRRALRLTIQRLETVAESGTSLRVKRLEDELERTKKDLETAREMLRAQEPMIEMVRELMRASVTDHVKDLWPLIIQPNGGQA
jgi:hypothetical protein